MSEYTITWNDTVSCQVVIQAESKEDALSKFYNDEYDQDDADFCHDGTVENFCIDGEIVEQ